VTLCAILATLSSIPLPISHAEACRYAAAAQIITKVSNGFGDKLALNVKRPVEVARLVHGLGLQFVSLCLTIR